MRHIDGETPREALPWDHTINRGGVTVSIAQNDHELLAALSEPIERVGSASLHNCNWPAAPRECYARQNPSLSLPHGAGSSP